MAVLGQNFISLGSLKDNHLRAAIECAKFKAVTFIETSFISYFKPQRFAALHTETEMWYFYSEYICAEKEARSWYFTFYNYV